MSGFEILALADTALHQFEGFTSLSPELKQEALQRSGSDRDNHYYLAERTTAIIPIRGVLTDEWSPAGPRYGATGYNYIVGATRQAAISGSGVEQIVYDINSPGGLAAGMEETADTIERVGQRHGGIPTIAIIRSVGASSAYGLAAAADRIIASPSATVGSIGTKLVHVSLSRALANAGIDITEISSAPLKNDASPFERLSAEARERLQAIVADAAQRFIDGVARRRGQTSEAIAALAAACFPAVSATGRQTALELGLVDAVASPESVLDELQRAGAR